ncbi:MAG: hypothetical protein ACQEXQ_29180 [Bacillota bacterium]
MAYDIHITRAERWIYSEETPINYEEYEEVVKNDTSFRMLMAL